MALKDKLFGLIDNTKLAELFNHKEPDLAALRKPLLKGIENARRQFEEGRTKAPNRWWRVSNKVVALTVKVGGDTFDINGVATNHMPEERFIEFLTKFKEAVEAGEFDDELKNKGNGDAKVRIAPARRSGAGGLGKRARPDDPEWMRAFEARHGKAPKPGFVPNSKGTAWVSAANAARGKKASDKRHS